MRSLKFVLAVVLLVTFSRLVAAQRTVIDDQRLKVSQRLAGYVHVRSERIKGVLVEVCASPWKIKGNISCKKLLGSATTDANGSFSFPSLRGKGIYYMRFDGSNGLNPLFVRVQLKSSGTPELSIELPVAT